MLELSNLKTSISWFDHTINHIRNRTETEYRGGLRRLILQRNKLIEVYHITLEKNRREHLGLIKSIEPHQFNKTTYETITFSTDYYF